MADEDLPPEGEEQDTQDVSEAEVEEQDEQNEPNEIEQLAAEMGWRADFDGDGKVDAKTFLKNTRDINRNLSRDLKDLKRQMDGIGRATSQMTQRAVEEERQRLEKLHEQAVEEGDTEAARQVVSKMRDLPQPQQEVSPEGQAFVEKHASWFGKNTEATNFAAARTEHYAKQGLSPARQLAATERDMKDHFPELFEDEKPKTKAQPTLAAPQRTASAAPREKGYGTLPPAARKACDEWVADQKAQGNTWATRDTWASSFYEQEATNG